jgi:predicted dinucleotide-binding enzyme
MKLAFIGTGNVGATLAQSLGRKGHSIFLASRNPADESVRGLAREIGAHASVHSVPEAVDQAEVVFLATPWDATEKVVKSLPQLKGKILVDCTNPLLGDLSGLTPGPESSGGELVQSWAPGARVVKAFNTTGFNIMADPVVDGRRAGMFFCGDDADAREKVRALILDVGFEPVEAGPLATARLLEPFALLWISTAYRFGFGRDFAFGILRR